MPPFDARPRTYILDEDGRPKQVPQEVHARWLEQANRTVARTDVGTVTVYTTFTGLDMSFGLGKAPLVFETYVYSQDGDWSGPLTRHYSTREAAARGHSRLVTMLVAEQEQQRLPGQIHARVLVWSRLGGSS